MFIRTGAGLLGLPEGVTQALLVIGSLVPLTAAGEVLRGFYVAGSDRKFHPAHAEIVGNTVRLFAPDGVKPEAVRYAWADNPDGNLYNGAGLPAFPFRSDSWPYYNILSNSSYSLIEEFVHPYKVLCAGFAWFHLNAMRLKNREKVKSVMERNPRAFVKLSDFFNLKYEEIVGKADQTMFSVRQKVLFSFIYKSDVQSLKDNVRFLQNINL